MSNGTFLQNRCHIMQRPGHLYLYKKKTGTECVLGPNPLGLKPWLPNERLISNAVRRRGPAHRYLNHCISLFMAVLWIACFWGLQLEDGTDGEGPVWSDLAVGKAPSIQSWYQQTCFSQEHCRCPHTLSFRNCGLETHRDRVDPQKHSSLYVSKGEASEGKSYHSYSCNHDFLSYKAPQ